METETMLGRPTTASDDLLVAMLYLAVKNMFEGHYREIGPILHRRTTNKASTVKTYMEALEDAVRILQEETVEKYRGATKAGVKE